MPDPHATLPVGEAKVGELVSLRVDMTARLFDLRRCDLSSSLTSLHFAEVAEVADVEVLGEGALS